MDSKPVPTYRFGDFTEEELRTIGTALLDRIEKEKPTFGATFGGFLFEAGKKRILFIQRLYEECKAAHIQAVKDGEDNEGAYYG